MHHLFVVWDTSLNAFWTGGNTKFTVYQKEGMAKNKAYRLNKERSPKNTLPTTRFEVRECVVGLTK